MNEEKEQSDNSSIDRLQKICIIMYLISPAVLLFILLILQTDIPVNQKYISIFSTDFGIFALLFVLLSIIIILLSHLILIPYINKIKIKDPERVFILYSNLIGSGVVIVIFGSFIGIYGFSEYDFIDWITVIPFFVIGTVHMIYIYIKEINPWFKSSKKSSPKI